MQINTGIRAFTPATHTARIVDQPAAEPAGPSDGYSQGIFSKAELAAANAPAAPAEAARPEVLALIDTVKNLPISGIKHTTRGLPRMDYFTPESPQPFAAGRFQVDFEKPDGSNIGVIFQTEAGPGHLATVVPGETPISGGSVAFLSDPNNSHSETAVLNKTEIKEFIGGLYGRFTQPMTDTQAQRANNTISYAFAIYHKEGGQGAAVAGEHAQLSAAVKAAQPGNAKSEGGWNLRG